MNIRCALAIVAFAGLPAQALAQAAPGDGRVTAPPAATTVGGSVVASVTAAF